MKNLDRILSLGNPELELETEKKHICNMLFSNFCKISSASWGNLTFGTVTVDHIPAEATKLNVTLVEVTEG